MDEIEITRAYLAGRMDVPVVTDVPARRPARLVVVTRIGGGSSRFVDAPRVDVDAWGTSDLDASRLARQVAALMLVMADHVDNVAACEQTALYRSDVDGAHRHTATFELIVNR